MRVGILGTGTLATALGTGWARAGHDLVIGGRSSAKARALAERIGGSTRPGSPREAATDRDAVLLAVLWDGVEDILCSTGAPDGTLDGTTLIDPVNAVEHGVGVLLTDNRTSAAQQVAALAPGAHVVKAFNLFAAEQWTMPTPHREDAATVAMCGDDPNALRRTGELVRAVGGVPAVLGPLERARQLEETAGFVIGLAFAGVDPNSAIPHVPSPVAAR